MSKPDFYNVFTVVPARNEDSKPFWVQIGRAYAHDKGFNLLLNALPLDGKLVMLEPREQEENNDKSKGRK